MRAATTSLGQTFLGFSRFPAARSATDASGVTTVRWTDMRFAGATIAGDSPVRLAAMFTATVRLNADGRAIEETLGR